MFQDNQLLVKLKKQLHNQTPRIEGVVKGTAKGFGFLEVDSQKSYFIPPVFMKKVMHGDKIFALVHTDKGREIAEPETLIEPFLTRFVGKIYIKNDHLMIIPDHLFIKEAILAKPQHGIDQSFKMGDWAVAEMRRHPLKDNHNFYAEITSLVTQANDQFAPWWVTLARHNLERNSPAMPDNLALQTEDTARKDLTKLDFITIDSNSTEDMDDAICLAAKPNGSWLMTIAIADPTAWVQADSPLDKIARNRAFTSYLPGLNVPMLPRKLSDNLCSLRAHEKRPALVCQVTVCSDGTLDQDISFFTAWIESKSKLIYDNVSDWLENIGNWKPETEAIAKQICLLHQVYKARRSWRQHNALIFKDRPDYRFVLDKSGNVNNILIEQRRVSNRMIEEVMIAANICAARTLRDKLGYGLYNVHYGFDPTLVDQAVVLLDNHHIHVESANLLTLEGFCMLCRQLNTMPTTYLDSYIRRFQTFPEISTVPGPNFRLGLEAYATWTSPIRKYGDIINHRLLKSLIGIGCAKRPNNETTRCITKRRRQNRMAERDVRAWLYARFLEEKAGSNIKFKAEIIDILRGGMRVRLSENGAVAIIPASLIHSVRNELACNQEQGTVQVKGKEYYRCGDIIEVFISEVNVENRSIIARPI